MKCNVSTFSSNSVGKNWTLVLNSLVPNKFLSNQAAPELLNKSSCTSTWAVKERDISKENLGKNGP